MESTKLLELNIFRNQSIEECRVKRRWGIQSFLTRLGHEGTERNVAIALRTLKIRELFYFVFES